MRLLIIEDDPVIARNIKELIKNDIFAIDIAYTGKEGLSKAIDEPYDLIILDWMLPDLDGPEIITSLRAEGIKTAVLMLTAKSQKEDTITGLNMGADDYLTKPFDSDVLIARVKALSRRTETPVASPIIKIGDLEINTNTNSVIRAGKIIPLSPKEFNLLHYMVVNAGVALDRTTLLSHVWDEQTDLFSNTVDVHIRYLRNKIDDPFNKKIIRTVKGKGYMLCYD